MLQNLRTDTKGNALAIFAAALVPLVAMVGSGLDVSLAYMAKAKMQKSTRLALPKQHLVTTMAPARI